MRAYMSHHNALRKLLCTVKQSSVLLIAAIDLCSFKQLPLPSSEMTKEVLFQ